MAPEFNRRPGAVSDTRPDAGNVGNVGTPGCSSLTTGALPRTTRELAEVAPTVARRQLGAMHVTADRLNVRRAPQVSANNVVGSLERGMVITPPRARW